MKVALICCGYPYITETFTRREVAALKSLGHSVRVFAHQEAQAPDAAPNDGTEVVIIGQDIDARISEYAPDVLYTGIGISAHRTCARMAERLNIPFVLRLWSGHDMFRRPSVREYSRYTALDLCRAVIVEDWFSWHWALEQMGIDQAKLFIIPNSVWMHDYLPRIKDEAAPLIAIGRLVEKKGFVNLVRAARAFDTPVWIIGDGPERNRLEAEASQNVRFYGFIPESDLPDLYARALALVAPCIAASNGDMDSIPTVVLEAMAAGCPVITSDLAAVRNYLTPMTTGLLVAPGNVDEIIAAVEYIKVNPARANKIAADAQSWASRQLDMEKNKYLLEIVLSRYDMRLAGYLGAVQMVRRRKTYTERQIIEYDKQKALAFKYFNFHGKRVLDIGCGNGWAQYFPGMDYVGVDVVLPDKTDFNAYKAEAEALPFSDAEFDSAMMYSTLQFFYDPDAALREARRVLRPDGMICIEVCVDDPNPIFSHQWSRKSAEALISKYFTIENSQVCNRTLLHVNARRVP